MGVGEGSHQMAKTISESNRLTVEEWGDLDYAAAVHDRTRNDVVRHRPLESRSILALGALEDKIRSNK